MTNRFYMMCSRETVGNNASFHCHNGNGYSSDIDRAHVYTLEEAQKAWNCGRDIDQPVCADSVDATREAPHLLRFPSPATPTRVFVAGRVLLEADGRAVVFQ